MYYSKLKELLDLHKDEKAKREITQEEIDICRAELRAALDAEGLSAQVMQFVLEFALWGGLRAFFEWNKTAPAQEQVKNISEFLASSGVKAMKQTEQVEILFALLAYAISAGEAGEEVARGLMLRVVDLSKRKDGSMLSKLGTILKKGFAVNLDEFAVLPDLLKYRMTPKYLNDLLIVLGQAVEDMPVKGKTEKAKKAELKSWVEDTIKRASEQMCAEGESAVAETATVPSAVTSTEPVKVVEQPAKEEKKPLRKTAGKLYALAMVVNDLETELKASSDKLAEQEKLIADLQHKLDMEKGARREAERERAELKKQMDQTAETLSTVSAEKKELEERVSRQASVMDVIREDKVNSQSEQLNAIAASLVKYYKDFEMAQTMTLSTDLEMTLVDLLEDIFKKLEKSGVDIKGRMA